MLLAIIKRILLKGCESKVKSMLYAKSMHWLMQLHLLGSLAICILAY